MSRARNPYRRGSYWAAGTPARTVDNTPPQLELAEEPEPVHPADHLRHGYTLTDLHKLARLAVHTAGTAATDWHERHDTAWSAIAETLYTAHIRPERHDLVRAGQLAIYAVVSDHQQAHGYYRRKTDGAQHGPASSPAFLTYWWDISGARPGPSPETPIVDRHTLAAILPTLAPGQRQALIALAVHDNYQAAAAALGLTDVAFKSQIARARQRFLALWHEGEAPSRVWGCDRRAGTTADTRRAGGTAAEAIRRRARARRGNNTEEAA